MIDMQQASIKDMENAWLRDLRGFIKPVRIERGATDAVYDPVEEEYTGGTNAIDVTVSGMKRKVKTALIDNENIKMGDIKLTILQSSVTFVPQENDVIDTKFRVISVYTDASECFWTMIIRGL